jgi:fumarate reductase flavoprotein subunit
MRREYLLVLGLLAGAGWVQARALGEDVKHPLPPKHAKAGVICHDCHQKEKPTTAPVPDESCMACHGDLKAMAELTKHLPANPHQPPPAPHPGPFTCPECHRQHKPAAVKCLECHPTFKFTDPARAS